MTKTTFTGDLHQSIEHLLGNIYDAWQRAHDLVNAEHPEYGDDTQIGHDLRAVRGSLRASLDLAISLHKRSSEAVNRSCEAVT
jgi:hypothetical protein